MAKLQRLYKKLSDDTKLIESLGEFGFQKDTNKEDYNFRAIKHVINVSDNLLVTLYEHNNSFLFSQYTVRFAKGHINTKKLAKYLTRLIDIISNETTFSQQTNPN